MSNATHDPRNSGDNRRRRSRGGKSRNNRSNLDDGNGGESRPGGGSQGSNNRRDNSNRMEEFHPQSPRKPRNYAPVKLTVWQRILKAVGLYKTPTPPSRIERGREMARQNPSGKQEGRAPKSNTRNARSDERAPREKQERAERQPRPERQQKERSRGGNPDSVESSRVYVGNLSYDVTEQDLQELFKGIGGVRSVEVVYNRSTHRSKGYGFVEMLHKDDAIRSVEVLHDQHFMGRKLTVSGAKSKGNDEREEKEDRPEREPRKIVVASANPANLLTSAEATHAPESAHVITTAEPTIQIIVENVTSEVEVSKPVVEHAPAAVTEDLESKYGFEPKEKSEEA
jgi:hypothetical protein